MIKRILVVVDGSSAGREAQEYSIRLARQTNCRVTGIGILDTPWITAAQPEPLGGGAYKLHRDDEIIRQSHEQVLEVLENFKKKCKKVELICETIEVEGFPASEIERLSHEHDMIIIGQKTDFHFELDSDSDITVKHIARDNPRPILAVPPREEDDDKQDVLVAYDGSAQSARALHMFLLLGLGENRKLHIVTVDRNQHDADEIAMQALRMSTVYEVNAEIHGVGSKKDPAKIILEKMQELPIGLIVVGSFSHRSIAEVLFGSCASTLMKKAKIPLFIHH